MKESHQNTHAANPEYVIEASNLTKKFGNFTAVDHISFHVSKGEIFGFLGANGAGKSTAMLILTGLSKPTEGEAFVAGFDVRKHPEKIRNSIGYMSQRFSLYERLSVMDNLKLYGGIYGMRAREIKVRSKELLTKLDFYEHRHQTVMSLPLGMRQIVAFTTAILHRPEIVFLDEPTGGVDPVTRRRFWELIYDATHEGITIFVTTHYMDEAEYCDRLSIMVDGKIAGMGSPAELKQKYKVNSMEEVFFLLAKAAKRRA